MTVVKGMDASFRHNQNGMTLADMKATAAVTDKLGEVIIYRSTGPWAKRWIAEGHPTKNFHSKGKSSDWGPQAGLVPYLGMWSKVGAVAKKADASTTQNDKGIASGFVSKTQLVLTAEQITRQLSVPEGRPPQNALTRQMKLEGDIFLFANRSGDGAEFMFRAVPRPGRVRKYAIWAYHPDVHFSKNPWIALKKDRGLTFAKPLEVMTSNEAGAGDKPMTGDYDLFAVCPSWSDYGSRSPHIIAKPPITLADGTVHPGASFTFGVGMDNVLDTRQHTMGAKAWHDYRNRVASYRSLLKRGQSGRLSMDSLKLITSVIPHVADDHDDIGLEHADMGNLTPRLLRCINALNRAMGAEGKGAPFRRVHHNVESHRSRVWFAVTDIDMITKKPGEFYGDGFPLTVFQPARLLSGRTAAYGRVCTLETRDEFRKYAADLKSAGYYVPKNWAWKLGKSDAEIRAALTAEINEDFRTGKLTKSQKDAKLAAIAAN